MDYRPALPALIAGYLALGAALVALIGALAIVLG